jgi:Rrf2 family protein
VRITAKVDYAVRALVELAAADGPLKAEEIADRQHIPVRFLLNILGRLTLAGLTESRRGSEGGYRLALDPVDISIADVIRAVEGPLADVHDMPPEELDYPQPAAPLRDVWLATRAALRRILERVSVGDIAAGTLPAHVADELADPESWHRR